ncbi:MAG: SAM-dependent methyltransferase [Actinomycetota bacterium]|nr:SAM-dependent methyltransferase [Actinomycetota bacterium]
MEPSQAVRELVERIEAEAGGCIDARRRALAAALEVADVAIQANPRAFSAWADGTDVPGTAYERLLPAPARRAEGQFQTPFWAADLMGRWLLSEPTATLYDPAVGSGRLLFRAFELGEQKPKRVVGWDIDQLCVAMAALNLRLRGVENYKVSAADFLLDDARLRQDGLLANAPDATIANPPFSRHQLLDAGVKEALHRQMEERADLRLSRRAGLHALFLLRALTVAAPAGRLAFITPAGWLDADYGKKVKEYIVDRAAVEAMIILSGRRFFFDGVRTTAAITLLRKGVGDRPTRLVRLGARLPEADAVLACVRGEGGPLKAQEFKLRPGARWGRPSVRLPEGTPLGELARVRRGVATGYNRFFVISEARRNELGLGRHLLHPCLYRPRYIAGNEIDLTDLDALADELPRWLLRPPADQRDDSDDPLGRYLALGREKLFVHKRHLTSNREPWFRVERRGGCEIVLPCMHRGAARFIRNRAAAIPLNTFHVIEPKEGRIADELWAALNDARVLRQLRQLGREYGNGLWKIEPGDLCRVRVRFG